MSRFTRRIGRLWCAGRRRRVTCACAGDAVALPAATAAYRTTEPARGSPGSQLIRLQCNARSRGDSCHWVLMVERACIFSTMVPHLAPSCPQVGSFECGTPPAHNVSPTNPASFCSFIYMFVASLSPRVNCFAELSPLDRLFLRGHNFFVSVPQVRLLSANKLGVFSKRGVSLFNRTLRVPL